MKFRRYQKMLKVRLLIYFFLLAYVALTYFRGGLASDRIPVPVFIAVFLSILGVAILHVYLAGYSVVVDKRGVFKEWSLFGLVYKRRMIISLERIHVDLTEDSIDFYELSDNGAADFQCSFAMAEKGGGGYSKSATEIPIYGLKKFIEVALGAAKYVEMGKTSNMIARGLNLELGDNLVILDR